MYFFSRDSSLTNMVNLCTKTLSMSRGTTTFDKQALTEIYDRYRGEIFLYAYRFLDDRALAEDCVADTFYRFLIAVRGGTLFENIRAYLYRIAHNWIADYCRRQLPVNLSLKDDMQLDHEGNPSHILAQNQDRQRIRSALLCLPREQRKVIELRYLEEWSHLEVAAALGKTVEATRALQHRAMESLRQILIDGSR
jgi:RNA polymerase sigma-70 factor (ECF subfamily)